MSLVGGARSASSAAFWALVFLLSMVFNGGESMSMRCVPSFFSPSSPLPPSPLFLTSLSWSLSLPRWSFWAAVAPWDFPGTSSGACLPGRQHLRALT